ncbi:MAG: MarR family winged helix-turn-helix transcriptional regulator [Pseudomonadota bacterium]
MKFDEFMNRDMTSPAHIKVFEGYTDTVSFLERLHRLLLDLLKWELDSCGITQVNNVQALLLYNISDAEMTAGELRSRRHYLGSNVTYNLKKLVRGGFIHHERSDSDRRSVRVRLTPAGQRIRALVGEMYARHSRLLEESGMFGDEGIIKLNKSLLMLEGLWQAQMERRRS